MAKRSFVVCIEQRINYSVEVEAESEEEAEELALTHRASWDMDLGEELDVYSIEELDDGE